MLVAGDDRVRTRGNGALQHAIVVVVAQNSVDDFARSDARRAGRDVGFIPLQLFGRMVELVAQDAERFAQDGVRNRKLDLPFQCHFQERQRLAAELQRGHVDIGIGRDAFHLPAAALLSAPLVHGLLDGTIDLFIRHAASTDFCFTPDSLERLTSEFTLHSLLDDLVGGLPFGLGLLPDTIEHVFRQGDVLFGLHGGVRQLYLRALNEAWGSAGANRGLPCLPRLRIPRHADLAQPVPEIVPATGTILVIQRTPRNS
jgi:hypothetical protein